MIALCDNHKEHESSDFGERRVDDSIAAQP